VAAAGRSTRPRRGYFPELGEAERAELRASIYAELLAGSLIAIAVHPDEGRRPRPIAPAQARAAIAEGGWRQEPWDQTFGYLTTCPGMAEVE
jgi:hypothetical protein